MPPDPDRNTEPAAWMPWSNEPEPDVSGHAGGDGHFTARAVYASLIGLAVLALGAGLVMMA